ncbi:MAG: S8 family serine peptidase [bacterium]
MKFNLKNNKSNLHQILLFISLFLILSTNIYSEENQAGAEEFIEGNLIIQFDPATDENSLITDFNSINMKKARLLSRRMNIWLVEYAPDNMKSTDHKNLLENVRRHQSVRLAQLNHTNIKIRQTFPDDPYFINKWGLHNTGQNGGTIDADIDAPEAWDLTTSGNTGHGDQIVIAIIDGGCDLTHSDISFFKNINDIPGNGLDDDNNGYIDDYDGWDAYAHDGTIPGDDHGTHCAGIAGAIGNNTNGVCGVNWNVKILPVAGSSTQEATVVEAYGYVLELRSTYNETDGAEGAFIVSTSSSFGVDYGNPANYPLWCAFYDSLGEAGMISAAATANINLNVDVSGDVPTACPSDYLISVTNTTNTDNKRLSAGYGAVSIDLGAPGTSIYSTTQGGGYGYKTGTSMSSPAVAGAVAFLYAVACPTILNEYKNNPATVALMMKQFIMDGVDPISDLNSTTVSGGRLNLFNSASSVKAYPCGVTIEHTPLIDTKDTINDYEVIATIISDTTLIVDSLLLHYEISSIWYLDTLESTANPDEFAAYIPAQSSGTEINYYLTGSDDNGAADTTTTYSFKVIDFLFTLIPETLSDSGLVGDTIWYNLQLANTGVFSDEYTLNVSDNGWLTTIWDETGSFEISSTGTVNADDTFNLSIRVIIPASMYGVIDTALLTIQSTGDGSLSEQSNLYTFSEGEPIAIPFEDSFPNLSFDITKWVQAITAEVNTVGISEPSAPYSANFDGNPNGADTIVSQPINLENESNVILSYYYQRTGGGDSPETDDDLYVEYLDSVGSWQLAQQHLGSGNDMTEFLEEVYPLPGDAYYSGFRLRIRNTGTPGTFDDWFIDDVYVGHIPSYNMEMKPIAALSIGFSGDTAAFSLTIFNKGANSDDYFLSDSSGTWDLLFYDATGTSVITSTGPVLPGDSVEIIEKVAIPPGIILNQRDSTDVFAVSTYSPQLFASSKLTSISAGNSDRFPFYEPIIEDTIYNLIWSENVGAEVASNAINTPSLPYVLNLDGGNDTLTSWPINLQGKNNVILTYSYKAGLTNPPNMGEYLYFDYKNDFGVWITFNQHQGNDTGMSSFELVSINLPLHAYHQEFQLRIRSTGTCVNCDNWFLDNIRVDYAPEISITPLSYNETMDQRDSTIKKLYIENSGLGAMEYSLKINPLLSKSSRFYELLENNEIEQANRTYPAELLIFDIPKDELDDRIGIPVEQNAGGPDNYGYYWIDSDDPGGPVFEWHDVSLTGIDVIYTLGDDNYSGPYDLGFSFPYYGNYYSSLYIGSNGVIGFFPDSLNSRNKTVIPSVSGPENILAWLWDDLDPTNSNNPNSHVYIDTTGNKCVIQFVAYPEYQAAVGDVVTAEIILTPNGNIKFQYLNIASGFDAANCAVGIENDLGTDGLEVAYLTPYLKDSLAVEFTNPGNWLIGETMSGMLNSDAIDTISLFFNTSFLDSGLYEAEIILSSNDVDEYYTVIPVTLNVNFVPMYICGDADGDKDGPNVADLVYMVNYLFKGGPPPIFLESANADGIINSGNLVDVADLVYMVNYIFKGGSSPICEGF